MNRSSESYHIHIDGPVLPEKLGNYAREVLGFYDDDFQHSMTVGDEGFARPACQLSRRFHRLSERSEVHSVFSRLRDKATECGFLGMIQAEFIMSETRFEPSEKKTSRETQGSEEKLGFRFKTRRIDPSRGENFKKHELHLELVRDSVPQWLYQELSETGLITAPSEAEVSFTASGDPNPIRAIHSRIKSYLLMLQEQGRVALRGRLISEATVCHSLHEIRPWNTPWVVDETTLVLTG